MDDRDPSSRFVRGLTLGALLGAIVAGSSLWRRSKSTRPTTAARAPIPPSVGSDPPVVRDLPAEPVIVATPSGPGRPG